MINPRLTKFDPQTSFQRPFMKPMLETLQVNDV